MVLRGKNRFIFTYSYTFSYIYKRCCLMYNEYRASIECICDDLII